MPEARKLWQPIWVSIPASADHAVDVGLGHGPVGEAAGWAEGGGEEPGLGVRGRRGGKGGGVILEVGLELVVAGHLVALATLFAEADPGPVPLNEDVLGAHLEHRPHAGEGVDHQGDQGAVAQPWERVRHDRIEQVAGFCGREYRRFAFLDGVFRHAHSAGGVGGQDLADDEPVEEHPDSGKVELDGGRRHPALQFFDVGGDVDRLYLAQVGDVVPRRFTDSVVAGLCG